MPPAKCPFLHRCNKYTDLTLRIDRLVESNAAKDRRIAALEAENAALKAAQTGSPSNPADVRIFGSSTPSSLIPIKENSTEEARRRRGGQPEGHEGHGRKAVAGEDVDETVELERPTTCPLCGGALVNPHSRERIVFDVVPARHVKRKYVVWRAWCPACGEWHEVAPPGVMPRFAFSNNLIAQVLVDHMKNGIPLGTLARRAGVKKSSLHAMEHRIAEMLEGGIDRILEEFRAAPVKHADETKWPCDGKSGYAWGFFSPTVSIYRFRGTRGSEVPVDVFGPGPHLGVLVVDRYAGYNSSWLGPMQYCLEHYRRNVGDLLEANPKNAEYQKYIPPFLGLLREAMKLRSSCDGEKYNGESRRIRDEILTLVESPVKDGKLKGYFDLIKEKRHRFFQWVEHPEVEAENNLAERRIRPIVTARKVCFCSQSEKGLKTRETLMTVIDTLSLRNEDVVAKLINVLNELARDPERNVSDLLWCKADKP